jgi:hypothetical protein
MATTTYETIDLSIDLQHGEGAIVSRTLWGRQQNPYGPPTRIIRCNVHSPEHLAKDNDYRQGATLAAVDYSPGRLFGYVERQLNTLYPCEFGWECSWEIPA